MVRLIHRTSDTKWNVPLIAFPFNTRDSGIRVLTLITKYNKSLLPLTSYGECYVLSISLLVHQSLKSRSTFPEHALSTRGHSQCQCLNVRGLPNRMPVRNSSVVKIYIIRNIINIPLYFTGITISLIYILNSRLSCRQRLL